MSSPITVVVAQLTGSGRVSGRLEPGFRLASGPHQVSVRSGSSPEQLSEG